MAHDMKAFDFEGVDNGGDLSGTMCLPVRSGVVGLVTEAMAQRIDENDRVTVRQDLSEAAVLPPGGTQQVAMQKNNDRSTALHRVEDAMSPVLGIRHSFDIRLDRQCPQWAESGPQVIR
jgi:hypothetical protein